MPTVTHYVLDPFLETGSVANTQKAGWKLPLVAPVLPVEVTEKPIPVPATPVITQTATAPYTKPESTPLPDSPSSFPGTWSPYIINHKRRGPCLIKTLSTADTGSEGSQQKNLMMPPALLKRNEDSEIQEPQFMFPHESNIMAEGDNSVEENLDMQIEIHQKGKDVLLGEDGQDQPKFAFQHGSPYSLVRSVSAVKLANDVVVRIGEKDSLGMTSNPEAEDADGHERCCKPSSPFGTSVGTPGAEFYDAFEEVSSDGASGSSQCIDDDLLEMRLSLLVEIERRKQAEEALENWKKEWKRLSYHLSLVALTLPSPSVDEKTDDTSMDPGAELYQQIAVSQLVAAAIARGFARAEVELEMETVVAAKNFEITRLSDRVHYYETANREMSQRNQEAIEISRQQRSKRKNIQKWFWGSVGLAVTLGTSAIAWSYLPAVQPQASAGSNITNSD